MHAASAVQGTAPDLLAVQYGRLIATLLRRPQRPNTHQTRAACSCSTRLTPAARITSQPLSVLQPPTQLIPRGAHGPTCLKHGVRAHVPRLTAYAVSPPGVPASPNANTEGNGEGGTIATDDSSLGTHRSVGPSTVQEVSQPSDAALGAAMDGSVDATVTSNGSSGDSSAGRHKDTYGANLQNQMLVAVSQIRLSCEFPSSLFAFEIVPPKSNEPKAKVFTGLQPSHKKRKSQALSLKPVRSPFDERLHHKYLTAQCCCRHEYSERLRWLE